jgi:hypothetical protein
MAEWRTQAQIEADEALHAAIIQAEIAYEDGDNVDPNDWAITEYIVITARAGISNEKAQNTRYNYMLSQGSIPWHNMMGLMDWAYIAMKETMAGSNEDNNEN